MRPQTCAANVLCRSEADTSTRPIDVRLPPKADIAELGLSLKFAKLTGASPDRVATGYS
jgi:hypothetical protein